MNDNNCSVLSVKQSKGHIILMKIKILIKILTSPLFSPSFSDLSGSNSFILLSHFMDYNRLFSKCISVKKSVWHHKVNPTCQVQEEGAALMLFFLLFFLSSATLIHYLTYGFCFVIFSWIPGPYNFQSYVKIIIFRPSLCQWELKDPTEQDQK